MASQDCIGTIRSAQSGSRTETQAWRIGLSQLQSWLERHRQRRQLQSLDAHLLKDIGLSSADAWREAHKPFWRA